MLKIIALVTALLLVQPALAATPFPMGAYVSNPHGNDDAKMAAHKADWDSHAKAIGHRPKFFNIFVDFAQSPDTWPSSASWGAWSAQKTGDAYLSKAIPIIGVPLASNAGGWGNVNDFYKAIIAGTHDAAYRGIVDGYVDNGYKEFDFRLGYEFNGGFMPWSPFNTGWADAPDNFVKAFRHVSFLLKDQATKRGAVAKIHWNPAAINDTPYDIQKLYPGDDAVDVISLDLYSPLWTLGYPDWSTGGNATLTKEQFSANPINRAYAWRYTNASQRIRTPALGNWGWSWAQHIQMAKLHKKPISIDESGSGPSGEAGGLADDPEFPKFLYTVLMEAKADGVDIRNVNIWDAWLWDGDWNFRDGTKPLAAAAWNKYFRDDATVAPPVVVPPVVVPPVVVPAKPPQLIISTAVARRTATLKIRPVDLAPWTAALAKTPTGIPVTLSDGQLAKVLSAKSGSIVIETLAKTPTGTQINPN